MNVVRVRLAPPVGPAWVPTSCNNTHATAPGLTNAGSDDDAFAFAQTVLESCESRHVARIARKPSSGLGLKKWLVSWSPASSNKWASGVKSIQSTCPRDVVGEQT